MLASWLYLEYCQNLARTKRNYTHNQISWLPQPEESWVDRYSDGLLNMLSLQRPNMVEGAVDNSSFCATWRLQTILAKQKDHIYTMAVYASKPPDLWWQVL